MSSEDFGYMIEKERHDNSIFSKKPVKLFFLASSILLFVVITVSAYFFSRHGDDGRIEVVKMPESEIKVRNKSNNLNAKNIDKTIYDNIVSGSRTDEKNDDITIIKSPKAAKPERVKENKISLVGSRGSDVKKVDELDNIKVTSDTKQNFRRPYSRVQLAALSSKESAYNYWAGLKKQHSRLFVDLDYYIQRVDLGKRGVFYRLQIGNFNSQVEAERFCVKFIASARKKKSDCIIVE